MKQGGCTAAATRPLGRATPLPGTKVRKARVVTKGGSHATLHTSRGKWYSLFGTEQWQDKTENRKGQLGPRRLERSGRARMLSLLLEETPPQSKRENTIIWDRANTFGGQGGKEFTSKSQCDETMSTFEHCKFDEDWEKEKVDYFLGWWLGRTRVTAVLSPVVALARQTGGYWGKRRGTSFFKYICKKEENTFRKICFEIHFEWRGEALDPSSSNSCMSVRQQFNNSNPRSCQTSHNIVGKRRTSAIIRRWQWQIQIHTQRQIQRQRQQKTIFPLPPSRVKFNWVKCVQANPSCSVPHCKSRLKWLLLHCFVIFSASICKKICASRNHCQLWLISQITSSFHSFKPLCERALQNISIPLNYAIIKSIIVSWHAAG